MTAWFVTHAEPLVDPARPIGSWGLSSVGRARADAWRCPPGPVSASTERKAVETAERIAPGRPVTTSARLGEIDRSATGYLPPVEFEAVVTDFFDHPDEAVRGWERAVDAQERIVAAVREVTVGVDDTTIVSHGAVGALLLAALHGAPVSRRFLHPGMGSVSTFDPEVWRVTSGWRRLPLPPVAAATT